MLWTPDTFTFDALGHALTVSRNAISYTESNRKHLRMCKVKHISFDKQPVAACPSAEDGGWSVGNFENLVTFFWTPKN